MTMFQLGYLMLWVLAIALVPMSAVLLYMLTNLQQQVARESAAGILGNSLVGRAIPSLSTKDTSGAARNISEFLSTNNVVLVLSTNCSTCRSLLTEVSAESHSELTAFTLVILCMGDFEQSKAAVADVRSVPILIQEEQDDATIDLWYVGFPAALVVNSAGVVLDVRHPRSIKSLLSAVINNANDGANVNGTFGENPPLKYRISAR